VAGAHLKPPVGSLSFYKLWRNPTESANPNRN
jgi:hypothetical protein